jgi:pantoate--beta-alanine ligase
MQVIHSIADMQSLAMNLESKGRHIGLVPTMGALHAGHVSLIEAARKKCDDVVVSIFVNPTQFGPNEDYSKYPRTLEADLQACETAGADIVFAPAADEIYPKAYSTFVSEEHISKPLCGQSRPGHFRGVTTVVAKLFNIVRPEFAFFGQKDAQQVAVIRKMVTDLHFRIDVVSCPIVREDDGLALSSRNRYLSTIQRQDALALSQAIFNAKKMVEAGTRSTDRVIAETTHILGQRRRVRLIYAQIVDCNTMEAMKEIVPGRSLLAIAAWVDEVRLIDNIVL